MKLPRDIHGRELAGAAGLQDYRTTGLRTTDCEDYGTTGLQDCGLRIADCEDYGTTVFLGFSEF
jgi:hypothetical protein